MQLRTQLFTFLIKPKNLRTKVKIHIKLYEISKLFAFNIPIIGMIWMLLSVIFNTKPNLTGSIFEYPFYPIIWGPIFEELAFRLPLNVTKLNLILGFGLLLRIQFGIFNYETWEQLCWFVVFFILFMAIVIHKTMFNIVANLLSKYYFFYFYALTIVFGLVHLSNPQYSTVFSEYGNLTFLLVTPQIVTGAVLGFIRLKYGLIYAIGYHMFFNFYNIMVVPNISYWFFLPVLMLLCYLFLAENDPVQ